MHEAKYYLGIDGGGSGCRARLVDARGIVLGEGRAGPATLRLGADQAWHAIIAATQNAVDMAKINLPFDKIHAGIALAGFSRVTERLDLEKKAQSFAQVKFASDGFAACLGAHAGEDGGVVSVGTGSIAWAISEGKEIRLGGYGLPVSDEGSGADMGVQAVRHILRVLDGRADSNAFSDAWLQGFEKDSSRVTTWINQASATDYAGLAPLILSHAEKGDAVAVAIVQKIAESIVDLIFALKSNGVHRIALTGGLATPLLPWLSAQAQILLTPAVGDAMDGALLLARGAI